jgi:hypothetical protein
MWRGAPYRFLPRGPPDVTLRHWWQGPKTSYCCLYPSQHVPAVKHWAVFLSLFILYCRFERMFSKRTQRWSHVKVLTPKQYEYIPQLIMKVCITFYAFLFRKNMMTFGFHCEIPYSYHIFKQIFWSICRHVKCIVAPANLCFKST